MVNSRVLSGSPRAALECITRHLEDAKAGRGVAWVSVGYAIDLLVVLGFLLHDKRDQLPSPRELERCRRRIAGQFAEVDGYVVAAVRNLSVELELSAAPDRYLIALRRSGLELLCDWFGGDELIDRNDLVAIDDQIDAMWTHLSPDPFPEFPHGLPASHERWWVGPRHVA